jgi:electron transfer flavoprotein alpha/beta subunit
MVNSDNGVIRYPTFPQILSSKKKPVTIWSARDIGFDTLKAQNRLVLRRLYKPEMPNRDCVIIRGASSEEAGQKLAEMLLKDHIL